MHNTHEKKGGLGAAAAHNHAQNSEEEKNFLVKFKEDFIQTFFKVIYLLLKEDENTFWKFLCIILIEFLQLLYFTFNEQFYSWRSGTVYTYIYKFFCFFHLAPWFEEIGYSGYLAIFYISIFIVILIILGMFYVSYSNKQKKFSFVWPIQALRTILLLITTIFYMPLLETFETMFCCQTINGIKVLASFKEVKCFNGQHIIHAVLAILTCVVFCLLSIFVINTNYKTQHSANDAASKINSRTQIKLNYTKQVLTTMFIFLKGQQYHWFLILVLLLLATAYNYELKYNKPYFNQRITIFIEICACIFWWGNICLLISKLFELTSFAGGALQLYFLGLPAVILIMFFNKEKRLQSLLIPLSNMEKGEEVEYQIRFLLYLIQNKDMNRDCEVLLKGYIYHHEDNCPNANCLLKQYKVNLNQIGKNKKGNKKLTLKNIQAENQQILYQHAKNMYNAGLQKFQGCSQLRISYGCFLLQILKKKQDAINEFNLAAKQTLLLDERFSIFRNLKMSEELGDSFQETNNSGMDLASKILFDQTCRQLKHIIEKSAQLHLDFWNQLRIDRPDLSKLNSCGSKINQTIVQAEQLWTQLQKLNTNAPKILKLYAKFHSEILNDRESGEELLMRAKDLLNIKGNAFENVYMGTGDDSNNISNLSPDGTPCISVSGDCDKMGMILQCNAGASRIFGYSNFEIKNHPVEKLMPEMYGKHHSKILDEALQKGPENIPNKERLVYARHKSGYIFPVWLQLKMLQSMQSGVQFIALFKLDKKIISSNISFLIINKEKKIQGISSSCIKMFNIDLYKVKKLQNYGYDIYKMAPDLINNSNQYLQKGGSFLEITIPEFQKNKKYKSQIKRQDVKSYFDKQSQYSKGDSLSQSIPKFIITNKVYKTNCQLTPLIMGPLGEIGFSLKLELLNEDRKKSMSRKVNDKIEKVKQPLFQFRLDPESGRYIREIKENMGIDNALKDPYFVNGEFSPSSLPNQQLAEYLTPRQQSKGDNEEEKKERDSPSRSQGKNMQQDQDLAPNENPDTDDYHKKKKIWGKGINIYVLSGGQFRSKDYDEDAEKEKEQEEKRRRRKEEEEKAMLQIGNIKNNIKSRKALHMAINDKTTPQSIKNLRITMNLIIASLLALAVTEFLIVSTQFQQINDNFNLIFKSNKQISEIQRVVYDVRTIILINQKNLTNYTNYTNQDDFIQVMKEDMNDALNSIYNLQNNISLSKLSLSDEHNVLLNNKTVPLYFKQNDNSLKTLNFSLNEAVLQISSAVFTVLNLNSTLFYEFQEDTYFVTYNSFNEFLVALRQSAKYYSEEMIERTNSKTSLILILFLSAVGASIITMGILYPVVQSVNSARIKVLTLFIEIPNFQVIQLAEKCEEFLNVLYDDQGDDMTSENQSFQNRGHTTHSQHKKNQSNKRYMHKAPKNSSKSNQKFFIQLGIAVLFALGYFLAIYIVDSQFINDINVISQELTIGSSIEAELSYGQNIQREMIYNASKPILGNQNSFKCSKDAIIQLYSYFQQVLKTHQANRHLMDSKYLSEFNDLMYGDICSSQLLNLTLLSYNCSAYNHESATHGLQTLFIRYLESLRESLNIYIGNKKINKTTSNLLNNQKFEDLYILQFIFLQQSLRQLTQLLVDQINSQYLTSTNSRMAAFIVFIIALLVSYLILWTPFVSKLNREVSYLYIWRTKSMLTIIPIEIILSIPKIQEFLHNQSFFSNENNKKQQLEEEEIKQEE